ncbi:uncharacterized protein LOC142224255 [Haematobia irritans]|uniref:uncharacterized protein LOC142224255 n=1 Tax=Haematobia irritans TaxID=7368 RepID=UPI003F4F7CC1
MVVAHENGVSKRPSIQELKKRYESQIDEVPKAAKPKSPKMLKKMKVKQLASIYNGNISQTKEKANVDKKSSKEIESPKPSTLPKPLPLPRTRFNQATIKTPVPSPRSKTLAKLHRKSMCFVAEDILAKLSVKEKATLYTQFVNDMSKKNPKFEQHAEIIEANLKNEVARGEVVNEKQESVKYLSSQIEARCVFPRQTIFPGTLQGVTGTQRPSRRHTLREATIKSKEFEDLMKSNDPHVSSLTITLQPPSPMERRQRRATSLPRRKTEGDHVFKDLNLTGPVCKRNNEKMRTTLSIDVYAPPKKIRRTRAEHLAPQQLFQNPQLEQLFYSWLKERQEGKGISEEVKQSKENPKIDQLLEEAIAKLENVENKERSERNEKEEPHKTEKPPKLMLSSESSTTSSAKHSAAEESESGVSNMEKPTTDISQLDSQEFAIDDSGFVKPLKPLRKKKMRRTLSWRKDSSMIETNPIISSTDSEADCQKIKISQKKLSNIIQTLESSTLIADSTLAEPSFVELDKSLMKSVNSPRKIKSAYTLTVCTPVSGLDSSVSTTNGKWETPVVNASTTTKDIKVSELPRSLVESFDQGFETGSNDMESPIRCTKKLPSNRTEKSYSPLFVQLTSESQQVSKCITSKSSVNPSCFSTPIKNQVQQNLSSAFDEATTEAKQQILSPISSMPLKNRRRSIYESESRRSSLAMQVIREDHPLEHHEMQSPRSELFFANAPTLEMTSNTLTNVEKNASSFWIKSGDFSISLNIQKNESDRIKLLYEIFSQRSCDTKDLHFGIDDHRFSVHCPNEVLNVTKCLPHIEGCSQYWFSTGDLAIPFSGKLLSSEKIQRLFQFIKASVEETGVLQFGVDEVEFSNVPQYWDQSPKFSLESNYSMLVGLQSGHSNGLEGRSKYAWPHSKPVPVSDLDQSDFESEYLEETTSGRASLSPFGNNHFDLTALGDEELMMSRNSDVMMMTSDNFGKEYENESLDHLFETKIAEVDEQQSSQNLETTAKVPEVMTILQKQNKRLSSIKDRLSFYHKTEDSKTSDPLDALKGSPEYLLKLKNIVSDIGRIGSNDDFKSCSLDDLERYMFYLSRYADICLNSCSGHMNKILDELLDQRAVFV